MRVRFKAYSSFPWKRIAWSNDRYVLTKILSGDATEDVVANIHEYLTNVGQNVRDGKVKLEEFIIHKVSSNKTAQTQMFLIRESSSVWVRTLRTIRMPNPSLMSRSLCERSFAAETPSMAMLFPISSALRKANRPRKPPKQTEPNILKSSRRSTPT